MNLLRSLLTKFGETDPKGVPDHFFFRARRLDYDSAQRADISKQNYTVLPRHWYVDATFACQTCREEFVFSVSEQRFWYEEKRFYVDSLPKRCAQCRKADRTSLELRKRYDALIASALGPCPLETKREALGIINELESAEETIPDRMKEKRAKLQAQLARAEQPGPDPA